jgi:hypothetical protein
LGGKTATPTPDSISWTYGYDHLDRLTQATSGTSPAPSQSWGLDMLGNWESWTKGTDVDTRTHNSANELGQRSVSVSGGTPVTLPFAYDASGSMTASTISNSGAVTTGRVYVHDAWNRLVEVRLNDGTNPPNAPFTIARYAYNGLHQRTVKTSNPKSTQVSVITSNAASDYHFKDRHGCGCMVSVLITIRRCRSPRRAEPRMSDPCRCGCAGGNSCRRWR